MGVRNNGRGLHFPCECVSALRGYSDPWAAIAQDNLLNDGTKEKVLNLLAQEPRTIAHLAVELGLSQPAVHSHVAAMLKSELVREAKEWEKKHPAENYYEPNFPVIQAADHRALQPICEALAEAMAKAFELKHADLKQAIEQSALSQRGWDFTDVAQFCYASAQRGARKLLEKRGVLPVAVKRRNGSRWLFWAEQPTSPK
jgi:DNA-binding transcriptional ArsR family regulator